jgi:hypothetical protein
VTRGRALLAAAIVLAAALVAGTALTAAVSLSGGFDRAAERADLPDLIVRFDARSRADVEQRLGALPNVETTRYRSEFNGVWLSAGRRRASNGAIHAVEPGRRGYAIVEGRDLRGPREVVVEAGVAREWDLEPGDALGIAGARLRIAGIALSPDNVAFPLAKAPRVYVARSDLRWIGDEVNLALAWLRDPARADVTLAQARAVSFGLDDLRFVTRDGVRILIGQAAGIVIALLVAFSLVAVTTAGIMLGASARSEVARRLPSIGVQRAVGFSRASVVREQAARGALLAALPAAVGLAGGALAMRGAAERLLAALNEVGPGFALVWWLAGAWVATVALVAAASAWPAWTATREPIAALLRGGELAVGNRPRRWLRGGGRSGAEGGGGAEGASPRGWSRPVGGGLAALGARLAAARRARWAATVAVLGAASATLLLLLALASLLVALRDDPGTVGKRYAVTANLARPRRCRTSSGSPASPRRRSGPRSRRPPRSRWVSRCASWASPAAPTTSRRRRSPPAGGGAARTRPRSASGSPTRSACGRGRCWRSRCPAGARGGSASPGSSARSRTTAGSPTCARSGSTRSARRGTRSSRCGWTAARTGPRSGAGSRRSARGRAGPRPRRRATGRSSGCSLRCCGSSP